MIVWIENIWKYFTYGGEDPAYLCLLSGNVYREPNPDTIPIPGVKILDLARKYLFESGDRDLRNFSNRADDVKLRSYFHNWIYSDLDNFSAWERFAGHEVFSYAIKWCEDNDIPYTAKITDKDFYKRGSFGV